MTTTKREDGGAAMLTVAEIDAISRRAEGAKLSCCAPMSCDHADADAMPLVEDVLALCRQARALAVAQERGWSVTTMYLGRHMSWLVVGTDDEGRDPEDIGHGATALAAIEDAVRRMDGPGATVAAIEAAEQASGGTNG